MYPYTAERRSLEIGKNDARPLRQNFGQKRNCIGNQTRKKVTVRGRERERERKKEGRFVHIYIRCVATGIGLNWIAASAVQTLKTSMWVGLSLFLFQTEITLSRLRSTCHVDAQFRFLSLAVASSIERKRDRERYVSCL